MSIPNTEKMTRCPIHPGEILREEFLPDYGLSVLITDFRHQI